MLLNSLLTQVFIPISNETDADICQLNLMSSIHLLFLAHPMTLPSYSSSVHFSANSPRSPRCSTPLFAKQRRTRPFIVCELCRQRAFQSLNYEQNKNRHNQIIKRNENQSTTHSHSTTLQYQTHTSSRRRRRDRRCSSIDQLLVWII